MEKKNKLIAQFMGWKETTTSIPKYHPVTGARLKGQDTTLGCFILPEDHPFVIDIYTERPGFTWHSNFGNSDIAEDDNRQYLEVLLEDLRFHESWDWLMPVIEKCKESQIFGSQRLITNIDNRLLELDILATHANVVDFIEFYNQNKPQQC